MQQYVHDKPDIETSSEGYAGRFQGAAGQYFLEVQENCVRHLLTDCMTSVLDVGGGHGQLTPLFHSRGCGITMLGSDDSCHSRLRDKYPDNDIEYVTGDLLNLPFENQQFDLVIAVRLISHITAWERLIAELCRVAKNSVIIDYPSVFALNALTPLMFKLKKGIEGNTRTYTSFSRRRLANCFRENDFEVRIARSQFFLPMFLHRALKGPRPLQVAETGLRKLGMTHVFGSPVVLRADRRDAGALPDIMTS
ncbi:MAG: class I SAM-dependent methyltransferase [Gammaproteobacteria bacterium]|nr:class I SAM-dependent methyltransferase [Gammaproteobacteria bacterium]NNL51716.1 methyltransferase domain-containing protein [Woeseiaceae bacterium]